MERQKFTTDLDGASRHVADMHPGRSERPLREAIAKKFRSCWRRLVETSTIPVALSGVTGDRALEQMTMLRWRPKWVVRLRNPDEMVCLVRVPRTSDHVRP